MGRREWKSFLKTLGAVFNGVAEEIRDLPQRMNLEGQTVESRLERVETAVSNIPAILRALDDTDDRARSAETKAEHALELYSALMEQEDSGSWTGF